MYLPLLISRLPCSKISNCHSQIGIRRPKGWWTVTSRPASEGFVLSLLNSSLFHSFERWGIGPTCGGWDYPLIFIIWAFLWILGGPALLCLACGCGRWLNAWWISQQIAFPWTTQCSQAHCWLFFLGLFLRCLTTSPSFWTHGRWSQAFLSAMTC